MKHLFQCQSLGVQFHQGTINGLLKEQVEAIKRQFDVDLIINCSGVASRELAEDKDVYPETGNNYVYFMIFVAACCHLQLLLWTALPVWLVP